MDASDSTNCSPRLCLRVKDPKRYGRLFYRTLYSEQDTINRSTALAIPNRTQMIAAPQNVF